MQSTAPPWSVVAQWLANAVLEQQIDAGFVFVAGKLSHIGTTDLIARRHRLCGDGALTCDQC